MLVSLLTLQGYLAPQYGSNGVFWTLCMEVHFYLLYPALYWISKRFGPSRALMFTLAGGVLYWALEYFVGIEGRLPYRFTRGPVFLPYWFSWGVGFYLAEIAAGRAPNPSPVGALAWGVLGLFGGACLVQEKQVVLSEGCWAVAFGSVLYWTLRGAGERWWNCSIGRCLAKVGLFSYSLYSIHYPLLLFYRSEFMSQKALSLIPVSLGILFAVAGAWGLFWCVERWSLKGNSMLSFTKGGVQS